MLLTVPQLLAVSSISALLWMTNLPGGVVLRLNRLITADSDLTDLQHYMLTDS